MSHDPRCLTFLTCTCCPACYPAGDGGLCRDHLKEAHESVGIHFEADEHECGGIGA